MYIFMIAFKDPCFNLQRVGSLKFKASCNILIFVYLERDLNIQSSQMEVPNQLRY
jgi:hypothetical protein